MLSTAYIVCIVCTGYTKISRFCPHRALCAPGITGSASALHPK